eukprot:CAMPEP_0183309182 /NCGR_PEP_ID=MMETSP0160_2-20130417/24295_1 /TAXON_ID=2839 ORGANISM="Odontella Sinensis, Strain Grunow 1884" /NCGR_SAMPLE_ID=MMETSP0160_2 /ASSEMBLY_ACC=CAM_ASM_000250 /LENGTH=219 /DNA_ID=CAMNT_0025473163 /DNA_START=84 /DNA_END=743 /DNA_ORIENTATION=-
MDGCLGHSHDHDHEDDVGASLRDCVDEPRVFCLNESIPNSGRAVLKTQEERLTDEPSLLSQYDPDDDPELLLHVPFTEAVSIKFVTIRGASGRETSSPPRTVRFFVNRTDLDFETARELEPAATLELLPPEHDAGGTIDYPLRPAGRFQSASSITLYFADNYAKMNDPDGDTLQTEVTFVGFKGKGTRAKRRAVEAVYETRGMKKDHKVPDEYGARHFI